MYRLIIATDRYAGDIEENLYENCFTIAHKHHVCSYKSIIDNAICIYYDNKPRKNNIENVLVKLNKWSKVQNVNIEEVVLLDEAKNIIERYVG